MNLTALKFHFTTPLHIGTVRADYDKSEKNIHSDTLYSAIIWAWSVLGLEEEIPKLVEEEKFTISSLFPYYQGEKNDGNPIYFFPKPTGRLTKSEYEVHKKVKSIRYLDSSAFEDCLNDVDFGFSTKDNDGKNILVATTKNGDYILRNGMLSKSDLGTDNFMESKVYPRVYVPRYGEEGDTQIYYIERLFFREQSGLFCLAHFDNDDIKNKVFAALRFLQDEGLGTDKHVGNGLFEFSYESFEDFKTPNPSEYSVSLSLFCPDSKVQLQGMLDDKAAFDTIKRGGWITEEGYLTYRKKSIYMFTEGSIFKSDNTTKGKTVDLKPESTPKEIAHPIYRVGRSLFLPIKIQE